MPRRTDFSPVVDGLLRLVALGGLTATTLLAPNAVQILDKPLKKYFDKLDKRTREHELKRVLSYMYRNDLVTEDYQHGLSITKKARKRLEQADLETLAIPKPGKWDKQWRLIVYDIPEKQRLNRRQIAFKLKSLGCYQLQRSVWIHPFPCEETINTLAINYGVEKYITYFETPTINNENQLVKRFQHLW